MTHTHVPKAQENTQKQLQTCTASRHYHLYTKFADCCGYPRLRSCFVRASSSELWACPLCRRFPSEIVCAKGFPRYRHFSVCDSRCSPTSAFSLSLFRGYGVKAFEMAVIEDDAGTTMTHFPTEYYANGWPEGGVAICATCRSLLFSGK